MNCKTPVLGPDFFIEFSSRSFFNVLGVTSLNVCCNCNCLLFIYLAICIR